MSLLIKLKVLVPKPELSLLLEHEYLEYLDSRHKRVTLQPPESPGLQTLMMMGTGWRNVI